MDESLWDALSPELKKPIAAMQHAGAAVLTGLDRLRNLYLELEGQVEEFDSDDEQDLAVQSPVAHDPTSTILSAFEVGLHGPPRTPSLTSLPSVPGSNAGDSTREIPSAVGSPVVRTEPLPSPTIVGSPFLLPTPPTTYPMENKAIPYLLAQAAGTLPLAEHQRSVSCKKRGSFRRPPYKHRVVQWRAELSHLQETSLVILRHQVLAVEVEWHGTQRQEDSWLAFDPKEHKYVDKREPERIEAWNYFVKIFETWLGHTKQLSRQLEMKAQAFGGPVSLGWSSQHPLEYRKAS
jgi:hypothetical protein